ncbi:MAG: MBL fold metallo-hydrolase [Kiritimatiellia bacterium]|nr:MBL fold metallo-hydrolase [Kiritimatiellia bacterium]
MSIQLCVLGSSSAGNATYVASGGDGVLIDAGFSARELGRRLESIGVALSSIRAVCLSHEHRDHTAGLAVLQKRYGIPVYANRGTAEGLSGQFPTPLQIRIFETGSDFTIGELTLHPFAVPHDAYEPVGFVIRNGGLRVAVTTDLGMPTALIRERLRSCRALVLEANHDPDLLRASGRPWSLKQRILGRQGHLSNQHAAELLAEIASSDLEQVFLAHLSGECNTWDLARREALAALSTPERRHIRISPTYPDRVAEFWRSESEQTFSDPASLVGDRAPAVCATP